MELVICKMRPQKLGGGSKRTTKARKAFFSSPSVYTETDLSDEQAEQTPSVHLSNHISIIE